MTNTIASRLETLNALRATIGKAPLTGWKNSSADLDQRIAELTPSVHIEHAPSAAVSPDLAAAVAASNKPVTKVPATSKELTGAAKRKAIIDQIADKSVKADKPTTVIDAKAASRQLRRVAKKTKTPKAKKSTAVATTPRSTNEFGVYLASINLDPKMARATLRRKGFSAPYTLTAELKAALKTDGRKKK